MAEIIIKTKRELFRFHSQQEWVNKGKSWYANCGVRQGYYLTVDAAGHVLHISSPPHAPGAGRPPGY